MQIFDQAIEGSYFKELDLGLNPLIFPRDKYAFESTIDESPISMFFTAKHGNPSTDFFYKVHERLDLVDTLNNFHPDIFKGIDPVDLIHQVAFSRLSSILLYFSRQSPSRAILPSTTFAITGLFDKICDSLPEKYSRDLRNFDNALKKFIIFNLNFLLNSSTIFLDKDLFRKPEVLEGFEYYETDEEIKDPILRCYSKLLLVWIEFSTHFTSKNYEILKNILNQVENLNFEVKNYSKFIFNILLSKSANFNHEPVSEQLVYKNVYGSLGYYQNFISHDLTRPMSSRGILSKFYSSLELFDRVRGVDFSRKFEALSTITAIHDAFNISFINYSIASTLSLAINDTMVSLAFCSSRSVATETLPRQIGLSSHLVCHIVELDARMVLPGEEALFVYSLCRAFAENGYYLDLDYKDFYSSISRRKIEMMKQTKKFMIFDDFDLLKNEGIKLEKMHFLVLEKIKKVN